MLLDLPKDFLGRMQFLLGSEFSEFEIALHASRSNALRVNSLKINPDDLLLCWPEFAASQPEKISWCENGFYVSHELTAGKLALHAAGAYYMQEASAQVVAEILGPEPGMRVLDLCAAPGGKSTHLAQLMRNSGLLVCNDFVASRARVLSENLERLGCMAIVTNESPSKLADAWPEFFDKILVDAPCSGEGMFRKSQVARREWSVGAVEACAFRQENILEDAAKLLAENGELVYSTCTFAPEENEMVIANFLKTHPEFELLPVFGFAPGKPEWVGEGAAEILSRTARLWPHRLRGEGHFVAKLVKRHLVDAESKKVLPEAPRWNSALNKLWPEFQTQFLPTDFSLPVTLFAQELQMLHPETPSLRGLKVVRAGVPLANLARDRLEPHHALSHWSAGGLAAAVLELGFSDRRLENYLHGESLNLSANEASALPDGWLLVAVAGLVLGWAKKTKHIMKNHYPKHLRQ